MTAMLTIARLDLALSPQPPSLLPSIGPIGNRHVPTPVTPTGIFRAAAAMAARLESTLLESVFVFVSHPDRGA